MTRRNVGYALFLAFFISGCAAPAESEQGPGNPGAASLVSLALSGCFGLDFGLAYIGATGPGDAPKGWTYDPIASEQIGSRVIIEAASCNRVSFLDFERGPVAIMFEHHTKFTPPEACTVGEFSQMSVLNQVLVSDVELAHALQRHGLPARFAEVSATLTETPTQRQDWTWSIENRTSSLSSVGSTIVSPFPPMTERLAWANESQLMTLDITWRHETPDPPTPIAFGSLTSDMLDGPMNPYVTPADYNMNSSAHGTFRTFRDLVCSEP